MRLITFKDVFMVAVYVCAGIGVLLMGALAWVNNDSTEETESEWNLSTLSMDDAKSAEVCNIAVIPIIGTIIPYAGADEDGSGNMPPPATNSEDTLSALTTATTDPHIKSMLKFRSLMPR